MATTMETVTRQQVEALRREAGEAGDSGMVEICNRALPMWKHGCTYTEKARAEMALAVCVVAIADAEAQSGEVA